jgi:creatinine amidohydrolase
MQWLRFEDARPDQLEEVMRAAPVAYLPWGALEWHSYHNPVGLDGIKAVGICQALAVETGGVVLPAVYVGTDTMKVAGDFGHTLEHAAGTVTRLATEFLDNLADLGYRVIVLVTGHYGRGHVAAITAAAQEVALRRPETRIWALPDSEPVEGIFDPNHAAKGETSYAMRFAPGTVELSLLPDDRVATLEGDGVWGEDPRRSTAAFGEEQLRAMVERCVPRIRELLVGARA